MSTQAERATLIENNIRDNVSELITPILARAVFHELNLVEIPGFTAFSRSNSLSGVVPSIAEVSANRRGEYHHSMVFLQNGNIEIFRYTGAWGLLTIIPGAQFTEQILIETSRRFIAGQSGTLKVLPITSGEATIDFDASNNWSLNLTEDAELQLPPTDRCWSGIIHGTQAGGNSLTGVAGWIFKGDPIPQGANDNFKISVISGGVGNIILASVIDLQ